MNAGFRALQTPDPVMGSAIPIRLVYPTAAAESEQRVGPYSLSAARDAPVEGEALPLVAISHGNGGTSLTVRGLALHLARAGFVVAMVDHPGNMRGDNELAYTAANLVNRPRQISLALDAVLKDPVLAGRLSGAVAVAGHSMGGYTALALAGAKPAALLPGPSGDRDARSLALEAASATWDMSLGPSIPVEADQRVRALVLMAPAAAWFARPGALSDVTVPILMLTADQDRLTPASHASLIVRGVADPTGIEHDVVEGGGHFAFQTPFPAEMVSPDFPPSQDPPGFERAAYQRSMPPQVEGFLRRVL